MKYHFKITKETKGYSAECLELDGCRTQANTKKELLINLEDALNLFLDEPVNSKVIFPKPKKPRIQKNIVAVPVDPKIAFAMLLRQARVKNKMTQSQTAKKLGLKNIYSYQRLENSRTANPGLMTIVAIKEVFPDFDVDLVVNI